jgi:hypothetical protein
MEVIEHCQYRVCGVTLLFPDLPLDPVEIPFGSGTGRGRRGKPGCLAVERNKIL